MTLREVEYQMDHNLYCLVHLCDPNGALCICDCTSIKHSEHFQHCEFLVLLGMDPQLRCLKLKKAWLHTPINVRRTASGSQPKVTNLFTCTTWTVIGLVVASACSGFSTTFTGVGAGTLAGLVLRELFGLSVRVSHSTVYESFVADGMRFRDGISSLCVESRLYTPGLMLQSMHIDYQLFWGTEHFCAINGYFHRPHCIDKWWVATTARFRRMVHHDNLSAMLWPQKPSGKGLLIHLESHSVCSPPSLRNALGESSLTATAWFMFGVTVWVVHAVEPMMVSPLNVGLVCRHTCLNRWVPMLPYNCERWSCLGTWSNGSDRAHKEHWMAVE